MKFKTPFKVLTTAALIGTLSLSAVAPGAASAAEKTTQVSQKEAQENFSLDKVVLTKGDSKITISFTEYALYAGSDKLNGYELAFVTAKNGDIFSKTDYALYFKAGDTPAQVIERLSEADKAKTVEGIEEGTFDTEDGNLAPVTGEQAVEAAKADLAKAVEAAAATDIKDAAAKAELAKAIEAAKATAAKEDVTKEELEAAKADLAKAVEAAKKADAEAALEAKVESVTAINASQVEVKFNKAVDKDTVIAPATVAASSGVLAQTAGNLVNGIIKINGSALDNTTGATLSEDGKTLTITKATGFTAGANLFELVSKSVKATTGDYVQAFDKNFTVNDTVRPEVKEVKYLTPKKVRVYFSEPLKTATEVATADFKYADGTSVTSGGVTQTTFVSGNDYIEYTIDSTKVTANKEIKVEYTTETDNAGNVIKPTSATFKYDNADTVKPTVSDITLTSPTTFDIKFSEAVQGTPDVTKIKVGSAALTTTTGEATIDDKDKTLVHVTLKDTVATTVTTAATSVQAVTIDAAFIKDLNDNENEAAAAKVINFAADKVKPEVASTSVVRDTTTGKELLVINYNENVVANGTQDVTFSYTDKDGVDQTITANVTAVLYKAVGGKSKAVSIDLSAIQDKTTPTKVLENNSSYEVQVPEAFVKDAFGNTSVKPAKATITTTELAQETGEVKVKGSVTQKASTPGVLVVNFDKKVDATSAKDVANYSVEDATVKSVKLISNATGAAQVEVTLEDDSVKTTGTYKVTVKDVKPSSSSAKALTSETQSVTLDENVKPEIKSLALTAVGTASSTLTATFSEEVTSAAEGNTGNFELYIDGDKVSTATVTTATQTTAAKTLEVTVTSYDLQAAFVAGKKIELKTTDAVAVQDAKSNKTKAGVTIAAQ